MIVSLDSLFDRAAPAPKNGLPWNASHVMFGWSFSYYWRGDMTLSIKWFFEGTAHYDVGAGHYATDRDHYLLLNDARTYSITFDSPARATHSLVVFFEMGLAEDVHRTLVTPPDRLLDDPVAPGEPIDFVERLYAHDDVVSPALFALREALPRYDGDREWLGERLVDLMGRLLRARGAVSREVDAIPARRPATREELYRRLYRAKDFMYSSLGDEVTLDEVARVACLSPSHLLRTFKQVFGESPHRHLTSLRLERAKSLLDTSDLSVTEICLAVGFSSLGSFSRTFRHRVGLSPAQYRARKR